MARGVVGGEMENAEDRVPASREGGNGHQRGPPLSPGVDYGRESKYKKTRGCLRGPRKGSLPGSGLAREFGGILDRGKVRRCCSLLAAAAAAAAAAPLF